MKVQCISMMVGAIAAAVIPTIAIGQVQSSPSPSEIINCPDEFAGITLTPQQEAKIRQAEVKLNTAIETAFPLSEEEEALLEKHEQQYEEMFQSLLAPEQKQQLEQLDQSMANRWEAIAPSVSGEPEPRLTPQQEEQLDALAVEYDWKIMALLTPEQKQKLERFEASLETMLPTPTSEQEVQLQRAENNFKQEVLTVLTPEQRQQFQRNWSCD